MSRDNDLSTFVFAYLGSAAKSAGSFEAYVNILNAMREAAPYDAVQVMRYDKQIPPTYLLSQNTPSEDQKLYKAGYYRFDPLVRHLTKIDGPVLVHLAVNRIWHDDRNGYFSNFYARTGMVDEAAYIIPSRNGGSVVISFQRRHEFTSHELRSLELILPLVAGVHCLHEQALIARATTEVNLNGKFRSIIIVDANGNEMYRSPELKKIEKSEPGFKAALNQLSKSPDATFIRLAHGVLYAAKLDESYSLLAGGRIFLFEHGYSTTARVNIEEEIGNFLGPYLSPREKDVVRLILLGFPTATIGTILNIGPGTIRNHRKRIFLKLDITTEREIFIRFINHIFENHRAPQDQTSQRR